MTNEHPSPYYSWWWKNVSFQASVGVLEVPNQPHAENETDSKRFCLSACSKQYILIQCH